MATTTNFGWTTPDDTDLVKDGAAAIRTLGSAIDTSLVDLKGGTTGQVLAKASNTDMDFTWAADASGIPATIFDAKGDLIAASAADTAARLAVGANGSVLTADSAEATGLKWATPTTTLSGVSLYNTTDQNVSNNSNTTLTFDSENWDTDGFHSTSTNTSRITIPSGKGGYYLFTGNALWDNSSDTENRAVYLYKNGSLLQRLVTTQNASVNASLNQPFSTVQAGAVGDYFEFVVWQNRGSLTVLIQQGFSKFQAQFLGA